MLDNVSTKCITNKNINHIKRAEIIKDNTFAIEGKKYVLNNVYGEHNIDNATVAINICKYLGLSYNKIYKAFLSFEHYVFFHGLLFLESKHPFW